MCRLDNLIYLRNKKTNKQIALLICGISVVSQLFRLPSIDLPVVGDIFKLIRTAGIIWVAYGLWKHKLGK